MLRKVIIIGVFVFSSFTYATKNLLKETYIGIVCSSKLNYKTPEIDIVNYIREKLEANTGVAALDQARGYSKELAYAVADSFKESFSHGGLENCQSYVDKKFSQFYKLED